MARPDFDEEVSKLQDRLPRFASAMLRWATDASRFLRWPVALLFVAGGTVGFLPILGFWMIPLGLILIARDLPFLQPPLARLFAWVLRKLPTKK